MGKAGAAVSRKLHAVICDPVTAPLGVSMTVTELVDWVRCPELEPRLWAHFAGGELVRDYHRSAFPGLAYRAVTKVRTPKPWMDRFLRWNVLRAIRPGDLVYMFPPFDLEFTRRAQARGATVVAERINCMATLCRTVLAPAFARLGRPLPPGWCLPEDMEEERRQMAACDYVTAPNSFVVQSLLDAGIPRGRILETSYGWSPTRLAGALGAARPERDPAFLFVGMGNVRKGLNLLLEAWERAGVRGTLLLAGRIDDDLRAACARQLARPDVRALGFVRDMAGAYAAADVFVFPSHEEGGPQVTYEAAACGLPSIVSPMGAGRVVRDGREGLVLDPFDVEGWARALSTLAGDVALRRRMGEAAAASAREFTWERVGARLREHFLRIAAAPGIEPAAPPAAPSA